MTNRKKPVLKPMSLGFVDALRDEDEAYISKLMQTGVNVATASRSGRFSPTPPC